MPALPFLHHKAAFVTNYIIAIISPSCEVTPSIASRLVFCFVKNFSALS